MRTSSRLAAIAFAGGLFLLAGCGDGINHGGKITGRVTIDGAPVTAGNVLMVSENGRLTTTGPLHGDGVYVIQEAPLGNVTIAVQTVMYRGRAVPTPKPGARTGTAQVGSAGMVLPDPSERGLVYKAIPEKYENVETAGLTYVVKKGNQQFDIPLTSK